ncbi:hypothetical protein E2562_030541, partial [Oryza meyeriana var. granulata]
PLLDRMEIITIVGVRRRSRRDRDALLMAGRLTRRQYWALRTHVGPQCGRVLGHDAQKQTGA